MKRLLFLTVSALLAALFMVALWEDTNREWTVYQRRFLHSLKKEERREMR